MAQKERNEAERIYLSPPHIGVEELRFIKEAFESNYIAPLGPMVDIFEQEFSDYVGIKYCLALSSGTAAMHLALRHLGIGPGDEVFASTLTFIGSVSPATFLGARPVFIDCDRKTWNMDPDLLEQELLSCSKQGKLPKAVIPTDLYGQCCDYDRIFEICGRYEIPVVIDAAEAMGAKYRSSKLKAERLMVKDQNLKVKDKINQIDQTNQKDQINQTSQIDKIHAGKGAKAAVYSFNGNKIMTTSGGGMLASDDPELIEHARKLSQQARDPAPHYQHSEIGYNYRMSNILAAIGRGQLRVLDERVNKKRQIYNYYRKELSDTPGIEFLPVSTYDNSNCWLTVILISPEEFGADRETVRLALEKENMESRPVWKPMHLQPVFKIVDRDLTSISRNIKAPYMARTVEGKVAEDVFIRGLCLPSGTQMTDGDLDRVIEIIKSIENKDLVGLPLYKVKRAILNP